MDRDQNEYLEYEGEINWDGRMQHIKILHPMGDGTYIVYDDQNNDMGSVFYDHGTGEWTASPATLDPIKEQLRKMIFEN